MGDVVRKNKVPKVDLLDINREPTDEELEALMQAMIDTVNERRESTRSAFMSKLFADIEEASKVGQERARALRLWTLNSKDQTKS